VLCVESEEEERGEGERRGTSTESVQLAEGDFHSECWGLPAPLTHYVATLESPLPFLGAPQLKQTKKSDESQGKADGLLR
jgi:hypothetical protein